MWGWASECMYPEFLLLGSKFHCSLAVLGVRDEFQDLYLGRYSMFVSFSACAIISTYVVEVFVFHLAFFNKTYIYHVWNNLLDTYLILFVMWNVARKLYFRKKCDSCSMFKWKNAIVDHVTIITNLAFTGVVSVFIKLLPSTCNALWDVLTSNCSETLMNFFEKKLYSPQILTCHTPRDNIIIVLNIANDFEELLVWWITWITIQTMYLIVNIG